MLSAFKAGGGDICQKGELSGQEVMFPDPAKQQWIQVGKIV